MCLDSLSYLASQPRALAPKTAASPSFSSESKMRVFPLKIGRILRSKLSRMGRISNSPDLVSPPKRMMAFGLEKAMKSAKASPSILPVNSYTSRANESPAIAASYTSFDVISSMGRFLNKESSLRVSKYSRAVRATPVAEAYAF